MNILQRTQRKIILFARVKKQNSVEDKKGCGRPPYYQKVLFLSIFRNKGNVGHFYQCVPRLAPVTVLSIRYQTSGMKNSGTKTAFVCRRCPEGEGIIFDRASTRYSCKQFMKASAFHLRGTSHTEEKHITERELNAFWPTAAR